ncbi:integrator complex subunit 2-like [Centruroides sculpturatus]|uniref:integrator complex subunit 2-like n=1 Tax=Centruroides sculpturatus TaxID=218467 RepID=UPI000C6DA0D5|nr:integrator complex subunit 2-like [Centruroides sculpturatus]
MCKAFPPLCEDVATLLLQLGKVCLSHSCVINSVLLYCPDFSLKESDGKLPDVLERLPSNSYLSQTIKTSFSKLCDIVEKNGLLTELREVQSLICSHVHQVFISDPHLAKLVHFQIEFVYVGNEQVENNLVFLVGAFQNVQNCPYKLLQQLEYLLTLPLYQLWPFALPFVNNLQKLLEPNVPREILEKSKRLWWKLNRVFPRRLWLITVNALQPPRFPSTVVKPLTLDNIVLDPLHVLRCDERIFRCAPLLEIVLHMLQAFLAASRTHLAHHMLEHPSIDKVNQVDTDKNREELRSALVASQESAAVQILLECCRPSPEDKEKNGLLTELREVQSLICSHVHQVFISDPHLAKLVHFQGYPSELLSVTVSSIPSMHICLDFIPELLSQPHLEKQVFAIELASYLCLEYAIPKSLSIAKLCINVAHTLLGDFEMDEFVEDIKRCRVGV